MRGNRLGAMLRLSLGLLLLGGAAMPAAAESQSTRLSVGATVQPSCTVATSPDARASNGAPVQVACSSGARWTVTTLSGADSGASPASSEGALDRSQLGWITISY